MHNQCIINSCWRSVPLPCGQYKAIFSLVPIPASIIKHNRNHSSRCLDRTHYYRNAHEVLELTGEWKAGVSLPSPSMQHCQVDDAKKIFWSWKWIVEALWHCWHFAGINESYLVDIVFCRECVDFAQYSESVRGCWYHQVSTRMGLLSIGGFNYNQTPRP